MDVQGPLRLLALITALVTATLLTLVVPAHAEDLKPTTVDFYVSGGYLEEQTTINLSAQIGSSVKPVSGTVTFRDDAGTVLAADVPVTVPAAANSIGYANVTVPKPAVPTRYHADFHGTNGFSDGTDTVLFTPHFVKTVTVAQEPTILKIGTGLFPQLTLTLAATARFNDGTGVPGIQVDFIAGCPPGPSRDCHISLPMCSAVSDSHGVASCKGSGLVGALLSVLPGAVEMYAYEKAAPGIGYNVVGTGEYPALIG